MQNFNKKASILLYSIILSLILSISFISLSHKININLKQNTNISENSKNNEQIEKNLQKIKNIFAEIKDISEQTDLEEEKEKDETKHKKIQEKYKEIESLLNISKNLKIEFLKNENYFLNPWENLEIILTHNSQIFIKIIWWELDFEEKNILPKNKDIRLTEQNSWKVEKDKIFSSQNFYKKIIFKNNSWEYSKISIISSNYIISPQKHYNINEIFWPKEIIKKQWILKIN